MPAMTGRTAAASVLTPTDGLKMADLRSILAAHNVRPSTFAKACGMSRTHCSYILHEHREAGELTRYRLARGLAALGLESEAQHATS